MRIGELAARTGSTLKAIRYYEQLGLKKAAPFLECLDQGHAHGDECVSSLAVYRDTIDDLDAKIEALMTRRRRLQSRLDDSAVRTFPKENALDDCTQLPEDLPIPEDDGSADHLPGQSMPDIALPVSGGEKVRLGDFGPGRTPIYLYPLTGRPGVDLPEGWDSIPGARGCSTEACDFRDHYAELRASGVDRVFGLSSQEPDYQDEVVHRLRLPFTMISDEGLRLADALDLPTFAAPGHNRLYSRLTLVIRDGLIEHAFYPIFPPNTNHPRSNHEQIHRPQRLSPHTDCSRQNRRDRLYRAYPSAPRLGSRLDHCSRLDRLLRLPHSRRAGPGGSPGSRQCRKHSSVRRSRCHAHLTGARPHRRRAGGRGTRYLVGTDDLSIVDR